MEIVKISMISSLRPMRNSQSPAFAAGAKPVKSAERKEPSGYEATKTYPLTSELLGANTL